MKKKNLFVLVVIALSFGLSAAYGVESSQTTAPKVQAPVKEVTKEELLAELKEGLAGNEDLFDMIPGLKVEKDAAGKVFYTFKGAKLEDLPKDDLNGLFAKSHQAIVRVRTERIQRQLETVANTQRTQNMAASSQPPRMSASAPSLPGISSRPSVPRTPSLPPAMPQRR